MDIIVENTSADIAFMDEISSQVTGYGQLPFDLPKDGMPSIIKKCAFWFAENSMQAVEEKNYSFTYDGSGFAIVNPSIIAVNSVGYLGGQGFGSAGVSASLSNRKSMSISPMLWSTNYNSVMNTNSSPKFRYDYTDVLVSMLEISMIEQQFKENIAYRHNHNTHKLSILSTVRGSALAMNVYEMIPLSDLYQDQRFVTYVSAKVMKRLKFILSYFDFRAIGNVTINYESLSELADEMIEEVKEDLENDDNPIIIAG